MNAEAIAEHTDNSRQPRAEYNARHRRHLAEKLKLHGFRKVVRLGEKGKAPEGEIWLRKSFNGASTTLFIDDFSSEMRKKITQEWLPFLAQVPKEATISLGDEDGTHFLIEPPPPTS